MGNIKKILFILLLSTLPISVNAASVEVNDETELYEAIKVTENEVILKDDISADVIIEEDTNITIDLNGFTLTNVVSHTIVNNGTLTIEDSSTLKTGTVDNVTNAKAAIYNQNGGVITLNGGTYTRSLENGINTTNNGGNSFYNIDNYNGTITINDGVTVYQDGNFSSMIRNSGNYNVSTFKGSTLIINGGSFTGGLNTVKNDELGVLTINGGEFTNSTQGTILNWYITTINDGVFNNEGYSVLINGYYEQDSYKGTIIVNGGIFNGSIIFDQVTNYSTGTIWNINGGTFNATSSLFSADEFPTFVIKGGNFGSTTEEVKVDTTVDEMTEVDDEIEDVVLDVLPDTGILLSYYDIQAIMNVGDSDYSVSELDEEVTIQLDYPTDLEDVSEGYERTFYLVRVHEGVATLIEGSVNAEDKLEFSSNQFSTYALTYVDNLIESNPQTGLNHQMYAMLLLAGVALTTVTLYTIKKTKEINN
ncbi:MAG: hypothetical protein R3Y21_00760 [Mycoplasmatota bacterium]